MLKNKVRSIVAGCCAAVCMLSRGHIKQLKSCLLLILEMVM